MDSQIVQATWQAGALSAVSNVLGQAIKCYQSSRPFTLNMTDLAHFVLFAIFSCPPNYLWQCWLEDKFPGYTKQQPETKTKREDKPEDEKSLNYTNTGVKFALDQTLGAAANTILFIAGIALLRGQSLQEVTNACREQFWPLIIAGEKLWPAVSLLNFTLIPVQYRTTFGSIIGMFWGIYLSLISSSDTIPEKREL